MLHVANKLDISAKKLKDIDTIVKALEKRLKEKSKMIETILSDYQTNHVTTYEIERCLRTLKGLNENNQFLGIDTKISSSAVMLPSNLPLYSFLLFALIPSFECEEVNVRPNTLLQENDIITKLYNALALDDLFPNVNIYNTNHNDFLACIKKADLVTFTGKPSNAQQFLKEMKNHSLLIINGAGHNPLVIADNANITKAVEDAVLVKGFNGGQDCAGPDAILVHAKVKDEFITKFKEKFTHLKTGTFKDPDTMIGPIHRFEELERLAKILHANRKNIICGGTIDYKNGIVSPTIIVSDIHDDQLNYKEMYSPITFIHVYHKDEELEHYFQGKNSLYNANKMYVSLYGDSEYITKRDDGKIPGRAGNVGIVLYEQTIHDIEIGYKPYGGYGVDASGIIMKEDHGTTRMSMPILIPEIITRYLLQQNVLKDNKSALLSSNQTYKAIGEFKTLAAEIFKDNLEFGFVFGSASHNQLKISGDHISDLDTFICLKEQNEAMVESYLQGLRKIHEKYQLKVDEVFPAEIVTLQKLEESINHLEHIDVSINRMIKGNEYDSIFWANILTDKKMALLGFNKSAMAMLGEKAKKYITKYANQILDEVRTSEILPENISSQFPGMAKVEVINRLKLLGPNKIIQACLPCDNSTSYLVKNKTENKLLSIIGLFANSNQQKENVSNTLFELKTAAPY